MQKNQIIYKKEDVNLFKIYTSVIHIYIYIDLYINMQRDS